MFQSVVKMRFQAAILFLLLAATCCFAADHLLRQQHEQELLKAKVGDHWIRRGSHQLSRVAQVLNPLFHNHRPIQGKRLRSGC